MTFQSRKFDIAVIGGGPGGYPAAILAAQKGKKVVLIESDALGGTCLNRGCIPSKTLIANALLWKKIQNAEAYGINVQNPSFNFEKMKDRKDEVVAKVRNGLESLIKSNQITLIRGRGKLTSNGEISVNGEEPCIISADKIILATGSEPRNISAFPFDYDRIHDSTSMLNITTLPKKIAIIGGGVIGCEFASLYNAFGVEVVIFEMMPTILPMECATISSFLTKIFKKKGIEIKTGVTVKTIKNNGNSVSVEIEGEDAVSADIALVSVGRSLNTSSIGLDTVGVILESNGLIRVNEKMETNIPGIYAVGDIASKWWLAHVATHQGLIAAKNACGEEAYMHYNAVPSVIFTEPEIGSVGLSLSEAISQGYSAALSAFPFQALGKSQATMQTEGFAQIVIDNKSGQVLGAQVIGADAATLVAEMGVVIANELTLECLTETIHAHPTVAEIWLEAALVASETPLHLPPKKLKH